MTDIDEQPDMIDEFGHTWESWVQTNCPVCEQAEAVADFFDNPYVSNAQLMGVAYWTKRIFDDEIHAVMVGDDRVHVLDAADVTVMDREAFCGECGQVGCTHDGLDRT